MANMDQIDGDYCHIHSNDRHFANPMYDNFVEESANESDLLNNNNDICCDNKTSHSSAAVSEDVVSKSEPKPVRPEPRQRTTIRRKQKNSSSEVVYTNVPQVCDSDATASVANGGDETLYQVVSHQNKTRQSEEIRQSDELPNLITELESMLTKMSSDSYYAIPKSSEDTNSSPSCPPQAKPRRSHSTTSTASTSSFLSSRPLPQPPSQVPPPKPPHLPPEIPPPPPPNGVPAPVIPPRFPIKEKILRDNVDLEDRIINPLRKMSEPLSAQRLGIVDGYYCQHSCCRNTQGIARSQRFRSSDRTNKLKPSLAINGNEYKGILQKCGYLWKTGPNRREFLDRWCVLHRNDQHSDDAVFTYYLDRTTTVSKGKIMLKDIAFIKVLADINGKIKLPVTNNGIDTSNFCFFEIGVTPKRGRVYLFAAKCLSDQKLWLNSISQSIAWDHFNVKDPYHCGYVHMKYGISGQWVTNFVILHQRQLIVVSKEVEEQTQTVVDNNSVSSFESMNSDNSDNGLHYKTFDLRKVMSISYASIHQINSCATVPEAGQPVCVTFPNRVIYLQGEFKTHTEAWYQSLLKLWAIPSKATLEDQLLTSDNIPVAIDKCLNFVSTYGTDTPNVYVQTSSQSPVIDSVVAAFRNNPWELQLSIDKHSVHDITTSLVLFLKSMSECILTEKLYHNWIKANEHENRNERLQKFKILLKLLPIANYVTLRKLIAHLVCSKNQTCILNIAPAFSHAILFLKCGQKVVDDRVSTFEGHSAGIDLMTDFILSYGWLFDVTPQELEKERKIQKALELLKEAKQKESNTPFKRSVSQCDEFLIGIYIYSRQWGQCLNVRLTPTMTAKDLIDYVVKKANLREKAEKLSVFEVVYGEQMERCLHYTDIVLGVTLSWVKWSEQYSHDNYLCVKQNTLFDQIMPYIDEQTPISIFSEHKYADKSSKNFKKVLLEFIGAKLSLYKDDKGEKLLGQWNIEDVYWYLGAEKKRINHNTNKYAITFIERNKPVVKSKESPYFGWTIVCSSEEEYHKWMAAMLCAEYPNGVILHDNTQTDLLD